MRLTMRMEWKYYPLGRKLRAHLFDQQGYALCGMIQMVPRSEWLAFTEEVGYRRCQKCRLYSSGEFINGSDA